MDKRKHDFSVDWPVTIVSVGAVFLFVAFMALKPEGTLEVVNKIFDYTTAIMGVPILWFVFLGLILCAYFAFSKYGRIKLGESKPEFSLFSYISMMICACLGPGRGSQMVKMKLFS